MRAQFVVLPGGCTLVDATRANLAVASLLQSGRSLAAVGVIAGGAEVRLAVCLAAPPYGPDEPEFVSTTKSGHVFALRGSL